MTAADAVKSLTPAPAAKQDYSKLKFHRYAEIFPLMDKKSEAFKAFMEDIKERGQQEAIWLWEGEILDGRNRWQALEELGLLPLLKVQLYTGDDPIGFVLSANLHRRHLNESQRAMVAPRAANIKVGGNQYTNDKAGMSIARAAVALNVSHGSVESAKKVLKDGGLDLISKVTEGKKSVSGAVKAIKDAAKDKSKTTETETPEPDETEDTSETKDDVLVASDAYDEAVDQLIDALNELAGLSRDKAKAGVDSLLKRLEDTGLLAKATKRNSAA
jgi:hypothetical protein